MGRKWMDNGTEVAEIVKAVLLFTKIENNCNVRENLRQIWN